MRPEFALETVVIVVAGVANDGGLGGGAGRDLLAGADPIGGCLEGLDLAIEDVDLGPDVADAPLTQWRGRGATGTVPGTTADGQPSWRQSVGALPKIESHNRRYRDNPMTLGPYIGP